ncbi:MAG: DUF1294 domain-containing protein [Candidatus Limisoma sp.]|nr:DUF1294 domain-containing protein [Candidatus Limisoma sp.]
MHYYSLYYLSAINVVTFVLFGLDKYNARKGNRRIREVTLMAMAALGGSVGAWMGMRLWHHKTKHRKFRYGIPLILLLQIALIYFLHQ